MELNSIATINIQTIKIKITVLSADSVAKINYNGNKISHSHQTVLNQ